MAAPGYTSQVTLNGIALDLDPLTYNIIDGKRRGASFPLVGGGTVFQDRGIDVTDMQISFQGQLINESTVQALWALYRKTAFIFTFVDFRGMNLQVIFEPGIEGFSAKVIQGSTLGWEYQIKLRVISVNSNGWLSSSFPPTS